MQAKNKGTLISIIVLLIIFIPCTIIGMFDHFKEVNKEHLSYYEGSLYFYDDTDHLVGTYKCISSNCSYAKYKIIDTNEEIPGKLINNRYAFINDDSTIKVYDVVNNIEIARYDNVMTYSNVLKMNHYIVSKDGKYGIIKTIPTIITYVDLKYSSLELLKNTNNEYTLEYILAKDDKTYLLKNGKEKYSTDEDQILYASDKFIIIKDIFNNLAITDYENNHLLNGIQMLDYSLIDNYIFIKTNEDYKLYSISNENENLFTLYKSYDLGIKFEKIDNIINVSLDNQVVDTILLGLEN